MNMSIIVDIVILAIIVLCIAMGYKRGLAKCLINVLAFFIAIVVASILFKPASAIVVSNTQVDENIQTSIVDVFEKEEAEEEEKSNDENKDENKEEKVSPILEYISDKAKDATEEKKKEIVDNTAKEISLKVIDVLCFIVIFLAARIVLMFLKVLADLITKLPLIKECDKIGGVIYGVLQAAVIIFIGLALITFISTMTNEYTVLELINQSYIGSILNSNNILLRIIF